MDVTETSTAIVAQVESNPTLVLVDDKKFEDFYEHVRAEAKAMPIDLTTEKGRKAIASMAHKIARTKTAIDEAGKKLNEEARKQINVVDESRRKIRDRFDALKDEVRQPLTKWEEAETIRVGKVERFFTRMTEMGRVTADDTTSAVKERYEQLSTLSPSEEVFKDRLDDALAAVDSAMTGLKLAHERLVKEDEDRAELARLRAENEAREAAEAERRAAEEQKAREAEAERIGEEERQEAAKRAQAEQERIEREARERAEAEAQARVEAAERAAREAEAAAARKIEEDRQAREREKAEQERVEREKREADAKRQADREHRAVVMGAAKMAIMEIDVTEEHAREIVLAIAAGNVPHVSIKF